MQPFMQRPSMYELGAVGEDVFDRVGVEVLVHVGCAVGTWSVMASAQGLGLDRPGVLHPAEVVDVVDVEVAEAAAAGPEEAVEALDLPEQFAGLAGPLGGEGRAERPVHAVAAHQDDVADLAVLNALVQFLQRPAVAGHQAHADLQVLARGLLASLSIRRLVGPSTVTGFSMNTFRPF